MISAYVDVYSEELHQMFLRSNGKARELRNSIRRIDKQLAEFSFVSRELFNRVIRNVKLAKVNIKTVILSENMAIWKDRLERRKRSTMKRYSQVLLVGMGGKPL